MKRLDDDEIEEMLIRNGIGLLAMVDEGKPYAIPMSFGYDAGRTVLPMQWGGGYNSRKDRAIESNPSVCLTVYEQDPDDGAVWRSVIIEGAVYEVPEEDTDRAFAALAANAEFPADLGVWGIPFDDVEFRLFGIDIENRTGREFATEYGGREK
ncbi:pyridoxamine 5'-phosphate oxidase family protein [Halobellus sp. GM3]|uniref:pyridoxamine 5'-phosphate oxidase family protein n=1 Tax=Halobellus sp. GM3 TaxID=3458410 RepID=UPI00403DF603